MNETKKTGKGEEQRNIDDSLLVRARIPCLIYFFLHKIMILTII